MSVFVPNDVDSVDDQILTFSEMEVVAPEGLRRLGDGLFKKVLKLLIYNVTFDILDAPLPKGREAYVISQYCSQSLLTATSRQAEWNATQTLVLDDPECFELNMSVWAKEEGRTDIMIGLAIIPLEEGFLQVVDDATVTSPARTFSLYTKADHFKVGSIVVSLDILDPDAKLIRRSFMSESVPTLFPNWDRGNRSLLLEKLLDPEGKKKMKDTKEDNGIKIKKDSKEIMERTGNDTGEVIDDSVRENREDKEEKEDDESDKENEPIVESGSDGIKDSVSVLPTKDVELVKSHVERKESVKRKNSVRHRKINTPDKLLKLVRLMTGGNKQDKLKAGNSVDPENPNDNLFNDLGGKHDDDSTLPQEGPICSDNDIQVMLLEVTGLPPIKEGSQLVLDILVNNNKTMTITLGDARPNVKLQQQMPFPSTEPTVITRVELRDILQPQSDNLLAWCEIDLAGLDLNNETFSSNWTLSQAKKTLSVPIGPDEARPDQLQSPLSAPMSLQKSSDVTTNGQASAYSTSLDAQLSHERRSSAECIRNLTTTDQIVPGWLVLTSVNPKFPPPSILVKAAAPSFYEMLSSSFSKTSKGKEVFEDAEDASAETRLLESGKSNDANIPSSDKGEGEPLQTQVSASIYATCGCSEHGNPLYNHTFPASLTTLSNLLTSDETLATEYMATRDCVDVVRQPWSVVEGIKTRKCTYTIHLNQHIGIVGPKSTRCIETQRILKDEQYCMVYEIVSQTPDVRFGTSFVIKTRYCLTSRGPDRTKLLVTYEVPFRRNSLLKGAIKKPMVAGVKDQMAVLAGLLMSHISEGNGQARKDPDKASDTTSNITGRDNVGTKGLFNILVLVVLVLTALIQLILYHH
eukprot:Ihof_evm5s101 gene=Ihof_evmTU5s101